ncbi:MAG: ABC transporter substrate-binding protein [Ruminiclostridium sp.]|nr:ABC transporter substrate-binding protein [Ruminiclostridium sp.]
MKRKMNLLLIGLLLFTLVSGCSTEIKPEKMKVAAPAGATAISIAKPMKDTAEVDGVAIEYEVVPTTDLIVARMTAKEADFAVIPVNLAAQLYQKKLPYKLASVVTWGNLFIASQEQLEGWEALRGKEIYLMGKGLVPDIVFRTLLRENGLDPDKDVTLVYLSGATELAPNFIAGKAQVSMLPEPILTTVKMKKPETNIMLDLQQEWNKAFDTEKGYPQAGIFVKDELIQNAPQLVKNYLKALEEGMVWLNENPADAGLYAQELEMGLPAAVVEKSMPGNNIRYQSVANVQKELKDFFQILYDFNPATVGGVLPDDGLYYGLKSGE